MGVPDYYEILGIHADATQDQIKTACKQNMHAQSLSSAPPPLVLTSLCPLRLPVSPTVATTTPSQTRRSHF